MSRRRITTTLSARSQDSDNRVRSLLPEGDLELIDALQINPRASWTRLGAALDVDPVTVARRWDRLYNSGEAWVTVALGRRQLHSMSLAFLELDCEAGASVEVAESLVDAGHLISVQHMAGDYDLWAIAVTSSLPSLADEILTGLPRREGIRKVRTHMATRVFDASRRWRLHMLSRQAVSALEAEHRTTASTRPMDDIDRRLFRALSRDGRATYSDLADLVDLSARSVQRRIGRLVAAGDIDFRCDLARSLAGWSTSAHLWINMPDSLLEATGQAMLRWPQTRTCAALAGPNNMLLTVGLHSASELHELVSQLVDEFPHINIADRQLLLRQTKLYGRVLDRSGRWVRTAVVDPWSAGA
ncbi:MAG: Lrp/AsnC family transcriptional regulator [Pseudonocardiaceae bacterium]